MAATRNGHVGVIGTVGTIASGAYQRAVAEADAGVKLTCAAAPGFVEFVERGETEGDQVHVLAERLLAPVKDAGVDAVLLGCTHYPFLARTIGDVMGREVVLVSSADEPAFSVAAELVELAWPTTPGRGARAAVPLVGRHRPLPPARPAAAGPRARLGRGRPMGRSLTVLGCSGSYPGWGWRAAATWCRAGVSRWSSTWVRARWPTCSGTSAWPTSTRSSSATATPTTGPIWLASTSLSSTPTAPGLPVYGNAETHTLAEALTTGLDPTIDWHDVEDRSEITIGALRCRFAATDHYVRTLAMRIDHVGPSRLAYSADTGPGWSFVALGPASTSPCARPPPDRPPGRRGPAPDRRQAGVSPGRPGRRLVLTHVARGRPRGVPGRGLRGVRRPRLGRRRHPGALP